MSGRDQGANRAESDSPPPNHVSLDRTRGPALTDGPAAEGPLPEAALKVGPMPRAIRPGEMELCGAKLGMADGGGRPGMINGLDKSGFIRNGICPDHTWRTRGRFSSVATHSSAVCGNAHRPSWQGVMEHSSATP